MTDRAMSRHCAKSPWLMTFTSASSERQGFGLACEDAPGSPTDGEVSTKTIQGASVQVGLRGWLYERDSLRDALGLSPNWYRTDSDLVLEAYCQWGSEALKLLRGAYVLWIWDERRQELLCTRDLLGTFPCFYTHSDAGWRFSDSVDTLLRVGSTRVRVNREALAAYLAILGRDIEETFFEGVRRLPAGWLLRVDVNTAGTTTERYWSPVPQGDLCWLNDDELRDFPALLDQAVDRYLQLGRPGIFLSGGLDSGSVAAVASERSSLQAFSVVFQDPEANEESIQRGLAERLKIRQHLLRVDRSLNGRDLFSSALELNADWPNPMVSSFLPIYLELARLARVNGADFVLTGDGGDEWLTCNYSVAAALFGKRQFGDLVAMFRAVRMTGESAMGAAKLLIWRGALAPILTGTLGSLFDHVAPGFLRSRRGRLRGRSLPEWLVPDEALRWRLHEREEAASCRDRSKGYEREVLGLLDHPLTGMYMDESYEVGRRSALPLLKPFYDPDVIEFLVRARPQQRNPDGRHKGLLRDFLHSRFPDLGYDRRPKPFGTSFFARRLFEGAKNLRSGSHGFPNLAQLDLVEPDGADRFVSSVVQSQRQEDAKGLWMLLSAEKWVESRCFSHVG